MSEGWAGQAEEAHLPQAMAGSMAAQLPQGQTVAMSLGGCEGAQGLLI